MATEVKLPRLGQGMESGTIVKWLKAEGDDVAKGEALYELDTDKVTQEVEAEASGVLLKIAVTEGEVAVGKTIAFIGNAGESVAEDVERLEAKAGSPAPAAAAAPAGEVETRPLSNVRKTIARRLTQAWTVPAFQLTVSADMTRASDVVAKQRELHPDVRITVTDLLTKLCAEALMRHPDMNVQYADDALLVFPGAHVGIAVAAPQGLVVPVVHDADRLALAQIAAVRADLVARARDGKLGVADLEGGTFTISNLGMYDVDQFVAVLNPPQASILAVGATRDQVVVRDGELDVAPLMTMTLTCDHRAVDGATGAEFLRTVKTFLEEPGLAL